MKRTKNLKEDYEKLSLVDDFMFCKIMAEESNCIGMLERLTGNHIEHVKTIVNQKVIKITNDGKGIRYDVYVEDNQDNVYDAEMQRKKGNKGTFIEVLSKRVRAYQGLMDMNLLESGGSYNDLKSSYVIFICTFDPFGKNLCCYEFENVCKYDKKIKLMDNRKILFFNTKGTIRNVSDEIYVFLKYLETKQADDEYTKKLEDQVKMARMNKEWRVEYMKTYFHDMDIREEGREEGRQEGKEEGIGLGKIIQLIELLKDGTITYERAFEKSGLTEEEFKKYIDGENYEQ